MGYCLPDCFTKTREGKVSAQNFITAKDFMLPNFTIIKKRLIQIYRLNKQNKGICSKGRKASDHIDLVTLSWCPGKDWEAEEPVASVSKAFLILTTLCSWEESEIHTKNKALATPITVPI